MMDTLVTFYVIVLSLSLCLVSSGESEKFKDSKELYQDILESETLNHLEIELNKIKKIWMSNHSAVTEENMLWMFETMKLMLSNLASVRGSSTHINDRSVNLGIKPSAKYSNTINDIEISDVPMNGGSDTCDRPDCDRNQPINDKRVRQDQQTKTHSDSEVSNTPIHLAVVACGDRMEETMVMIKSCLLFTRAQIHLHIFTDDHLQPLFSKELEGLPANFMKYLTFDIYDIQHPKGKETINWRNLEQSKPCASQRLFFPDLLHHIKRLIYVDTDVLMMRPLGDMWDFFKHFNETQIAAMTWEHENAGTGWYNRFARHPFYPPYGLNSGVILMDLERMRAARWTNHITAYYEQYKKSLVWKDQDLFNIFFHFNPEKLLVIGCDWNYRPDHCMYGLDCKSAGKNGASIIHGSRQVFHNDKQPSFKAVYTSFMKFDYNNHGIDALLELVMNNLVEMETPKDECSRSKDVFTKRLNRTVTEILGNN